MKPLPAVGDRFGRYVVTASGLRKGKVLACAVRCDCGNERVVQLGALRLGKSRSCGCAPRTRSKVVPAADLIGQRFERLTVTAVGPCTTTGGRTLTVRCDCGETREVSIRNLRSGNTRSCGCLQREHAVARVASGELAATVRKHGLSGTPGFARWQAMIDRCENPENDGFKHYGGRGITVCARWHDVTLFVADVGDPPTERHTIDRIDNDGGYWCGRADCADCGPALRACNVRFATPEQQARNKRNTLWIVLDGKRVPACDVCAAHGVSRQAFGSRLRHGWTPVEAATTPPSPRAVASGRRAATFRHPRRTEAA